MIVCHTLCMCVNPKLLMPMRAMTAHQVILTGGHRISGYKSTEQQSQCSGQKGSKELQRAPSAVTGVCVQPRCPQECLLGRRPRSAHHACPQALKPALPLQHIMHLWHAPSVRRLCGALVSVHMTAPDSCKLRL